MSVVASITKCMIAYPGSTRHDIAHLLKVWAYAKAIGELEGLDAQTQQTLEIAALTHDIACPLCRQKYGSAAQRCRKKKARRWCARCLKILRSMQTSSTASPSSSRIIIRSI